MHPRYSAFSFSRNLKCWGFLSQQRNPVMSLWAVKFGQVDHVREDSRRKGNRGSQRLWSTRFLLKSLSHLSIAGQKESVSVCASHSLMKNDPSITTHGVDDPDSRSYSCFRCGTDAEPHYHCLLLQHSAAISSREPEKSEIFVVHSDTFSVRWLLRYGRWIQDTGVLPFAR